MKNRKEKVRKLIGNLSARMVELKAIEQMKMRPEYVSSFWEAWDEFDCACFEYLAFDFDSWDIVTEKACAVYCHDLLLS